MDDLTCMIAMLNLIHSENCTIIKMLSGKHKEFDKYADECEDCFEKIVLTYANDSKVVG